MTKKKVEENIFSLTTRNTKLRAIPIARRNSESTKRKSLDEEKHLTTTIAIWPAYVESRLVHEHDVFFLNSMSTFRQIIMRYHDNTVSLGRKWIEKLKERAQVLKRKVEVMRKWSKAKREGTTLMRKMTMGSINNKLRNKSSKGESTNSDKRKEISNAKSRSKAKWEGTTEIRKMTIVSYDNKLKKKVNRKAERERAQILRKEK